MSVPSANFAFLADHDPLLAELGSRAERYFAADPNTSLIKLRQLAEARGEVVVEGRLSSMSHSVFDRIRQAFTGQ